MEGQTSGAVRVAVLRVEGPGAPRALGAAPLLSRPRSCGLVSLSGVQAPRWQQQEEPEGLAGFMTCDVSSSLVTNVLPRARHSLSGAGGELTGALHFLLRVSVDLKLLQETKCVRCSPRR